MHALEEALKDLDEHLQQREDNDSFSDSPETNDVE